jgi:hypothetical protein
MDTDCPALFRICEDGDRLKPWKSSNADLHPIAQEPPLHCRRREGGTKKGMRDGFNVRANASCNCRVTVIRIVAE